MKALEAIGGIGGLVVLLTAIVVIGRGIFRQVSVTEDNTKALTDLTGEVRELRTGYNNHDTRLGILEDRTHR